MCCIIWPLVKDSLESIWGQGGWEEVQVLKGVASLMAKGLEGENTDDCKICANMEYISGGFWGICSFLRVKAPPSLIGNTKTPVKWRRSLTGFGFLSSFCWLRWTPGGCGWLGPWTSARPRKGNQPTVCLWRTEQRRCEEGGFYGCCRADCRGPTHNQRFPFHYIKGAFITSVSGIIIHTEGKKKKKACVSCGSCNVTWCLTSTPRGLKKRDGSSFIDTNSPFLNQPNTEILTFKKWFTYENVVIKIHFHFWQLINTR